MEDSPDARVQIKYSHSGFFGLKPWNFHPGENFSVEGSFPLVIYLLPMAGKYE